MKAIAVEAMPSARRSSPRMRGAGLPEIEIVAGEAPAALGGPPIPGRRCSSAAGSRPGPGRALLARLPAGGRLVANVVTVEGEICVARHRGELGGSLTRIAISRAEPVGPFSAGAR